ncbi:MAG: SpoIIE family protein phosphatase [Flavobacteriales bacterium]|nr:SpoIIE family protein phosphatase [Flavobacteriales bacterium]
MNNFAKHIFNKNLDRVENEWDKRGLRIINTLIFSLGILMILFFLLSFWIKLDAARPVVMVVFIITVIHFWISKWISFNGIKLYASLLPIALVSVISLIIVGKGGGDRFYFASTLILPMLFYNEKRWYFPIVLVNIGAFITVSILQNYIEPLASMDESDKVIYAGINGLAICLLILIMLKVFKNEIAGFQQMISDQKQALEIKNHEITESITYAKGIQEAILPSRGFLDSEFSKGYVLYMPKDIVAGDFYWIEKQDEFLYFADADCTGHGVPGAMVSVVCHGALQQSLYEFGKRNPSEILEMTSTIVSDTFSKSEREIKDGMDLGLCRWDEKNRILMYAGANNPVWILSENENLETDSMILTSNFEGRFLHEIKATKRPIGNSGTKNTYQNHVVKLNEGDEVFLQTDGFADQFGGDKGKKYKYSQLKSFLLENQYLLGRTKQLQTEFNKWIGDIEQIDDVCIVGLRV